MPARQCRRCHKDITHKRADSIYCHYVCREAFYRHGPLPVRLTETPSVVP